MEPQGREHVYTVDADGNRTWHVVQVRGRELRRGMEFTFLAEGNPVRVAFLDAREAPGGALVLRGATTSGAVLGCRVGDVVTVHRRASGASM